MMEIKNRISISNAQLKDELLKLFESGKTGKSELIGVLRSSFKLGNDRYFKNYDVVYLEWATLKDSANREQITTNAKEQLQAPLKSKLERLADLEKMLHPTYKVKETRFDYKTCKAINYHRTLQPDEIKNIHSEISKMNGDYTPSKTALTNIKGEDLPTKRQVMIINGQEIEF